VMITADDRYWYADVRLYAFDAASLHDELFHLSLFHIETLLFLEHFFIANAVPCCPPARAYPALPAPCSCSGRGTGCLCDRCTSPSLRPARRSPSPDGPWQGRRCGLQDICAMVSRFIVSMSVEQPMRADASAASHPACPAPMTMTSYLFW